MGTFRPLVTPILLYFLLAKNFERYTLAGVSSSCGFFVSFTSFKHSWDSCSDLRIWLCSSRNYSDQFIIETNCCRLTLLTFIVGSS